MYVSIKEPLKVWRTAAKTTNVLTIFEYIFLWFIYFLNMHIHSRTHATTQPIFFASWHFALLELSIFALHYCRVFFSSKVFTSSHSSFRVDIVFHRCYCLCRSPHENDSRKRPVDENVRMDEKWRNLWSIFSFDWSFSKRLDFFSRITPIKIYSFKRKSCFFR